MRHVKRWLLFWTKCAVATWLVHTAAGLGWVQSLAAVTLVLWCALEAFRVLARLLEAFAGHSGEDDDGGVGPEVDSPLVVIRTEPVRKEWRN